MKYVKPSRQVMHARPELPKRANLSWATNDKLSRRRKTWNDQLESGSDDSLENMKKMTTRRSDYQQIGSPLTIEI